MSREVDNIQRLMNDKQVEFRDFRISKFDTRKNDEGKDELIIEGVPCVFNSETVLYKGKYYEAREVIDKKAFEKCDMSDVIFNYNHGGRVFARTRNGSLTVWVEQDGLHMRAILMNDDNGHAEVYRDIKSGLIDKMSFAFHVSSSEYKYIDLDEFEIEIRTITGIDKLYDVSAVDIPAYDATSISARSVFEAERERKQAESLKRAKDITLLKLKLGGI